MSAEIGQVGVPLGGARTQGPPQDVDNDTTTVAGLFTTIGVLTVERDQWKARAIRYLREFEQAQAEIVALKKGGGGPVGPPDLVVTET